MSLFNIVTTVNMVNILSHEIFCLVCVITCFIVKHPVKYASASTLDANANVQCMSIIRLISFHNVASLPMSSRFHHALLSHGQLQKFHRKCEDLHCTKSKLLHLIITK